MTDHRKTAVYIRLSAEDDNVDGRAKKESDSVTSQRILLKSFVIDQLGVAESDILEYVDDGVSGTHFKRQGFQQLQDDMKSGEIGCVVVKDFSRFGRDYLEVGFYIEYIFPLLQIRFISINDSYDSAARSKAAIRRMIPESVSPISISRIAFVDINPGIKSIISPIIILSI